MTVEPTGNKDISGLGSLNKGTAYQNFSGSTLGKEAILNLKKANSDLFAARQSDIDTELDSLCTEYDFVKRKKDSKAWTSQQAIDTDIIVAEPGIKGPSPAFRLQDDKLACINYPGSHEPMNIEEFKVYLEDVNTKINGTAEKSDIDTELDSLCEKYDFVKRKKDSTEWTATQAKDTDIVVSEPGIKGERPAFRLQDDKLACINYPGSHEPMNIEEFKVYLEDVNTKINGTAEKPDIDTELDSLCTEYDFVKRKKDSKAWTSQQAIDTDIVVAEPGIKGEKPAFRLQDDKLACINYSGSHEPMNMEEFKAYLDGVNTKINGTAEKSDIDTEEKS